MMALRQPPSSKLAVPPKLGHSSIRHFSRLRTRIGLPCALPISSLGFAPVFPNRSPRQRRMHFQHFHNILPRRSKFCKFKSVFSFSALIFAAFLGEIVKNVFSLSFIILFENISFSVVNFKISPYFLLIYY